MTVCNLEFARWIQKQTEDIASGEINSNEIPLLNKLGETILFVQKPVSTALLSGTELYFSRIRCPHKVHHDELSRIYGAFLFDTDLQKKIPENPANEEWMKTWMNDAGEIFGHLDAKIIARPYEVLNENDIIHHRQKIKTLIEADKLRPAGMATERPVRAGI